MMRELLNATPGLSCDFPRTAEEACSVRAIPIFVSSIRSRSESFTSIRNFTRSEAVKAVFALFISNRKSRRTRCATMRCILLSVSNTKNARGDHWNFTRWDLVDLAQFKVKLKAEFQGEQPRSLPPRSDRGERKAPKCNQGAGQSAALLLLAVTARHHLCRRNGGEKRLKREFSSTQSKRTSKKTTQPSSRTWKLRSSCDRIIKFTCTISRRIRFVGRKKEAITLLSQAASMGFVFPEVEKDSDFSSLRGKGDFDAVLKNCRQRNTNQP